MYKYKRRRRLLKWRIRGEEMHPSIQNASHTAFVPDQRLHLQFMIKHKMCEYLYHSFVAWNMTVADLLPAHLQHNTNISLLGFPRPLHIKNYPNCRI